MESSVFRLSTKLVALYPNDRFGLMEFDNYHSMFFPSIYKVKITSIK